MVQKFYSLNSNSNAEIYQFFRRCGANEVHVSLTRQLEGYPKGVDGILICQRVVHQSGAMCEYVIDAIGPQSLYMKSHNSHNCHHCNVERSGMIPQLALRHA